MEQKVRGTTTTVSVTDFVAQTNSGGMLGLYPRNWRIVSTVLSFHTILKIKNTPLELVNWNL